MANRRQFLTTIGTVTTLLTAGCYEEPPDSQEVGGQQITEQPTATSTQAIVEKTAPEAIPLPGEPHSTGKGDLPVQRAVKTLKTSSIGFDSEKGAADFDRSRVNINKEDHTARIFLASDHRGTGQASGFGSGSFQTAWEAPSSGEYRLNAFYHRAGSLNYDYPDHGNISGSFDTSVMAIRHRDSQVIAKGIRPELPHRNGALRDEVAEFLVETAVTALIGSVLGLGLIARFFLGQVIDRLIELDGYSGNGDSQIYDVSDRINPNYDQRRYLSITFGASAGEVLIFEFSSALSIAFDIRGSWWFQPTFFGHGNFVTFQIEPI